MDAVEHTWSSYSETLERCLLTGEPASWIADIGVPVRLVVGTDDPVVDLEFIDELARHNHMRVDRWPGDHRLPLANPTGCIEAILR